MNNYLNIKLTGAEEALKGLSEMDAKLREVSALIEQLYANRPTLETLLNPRDVTGQGD